MLADQAAVYSREIDGRTLTLAPSGWSADRRRRHGGDLVTFMERARRDPSNARADRDAALVLSEGRGEAERRSRRDGCGAFASCSFSSGGATFDDPSRAALPV